MTILQPRLYITFLLLLICHLGFSQVQDIGKITFWNKTESGISGKTEHATFKVEIINANIVRVRVSQNPTWNDFSYLLTNDPIPGSNAHQLQTSGDAIYLVTPALQVKVEKAPNFRVSFLTNSYQVINEDYPGDGFGTSFIGQRSTLYKRLFPNERFVGLGEVLGNLDKRGSAYTLNNTDTYKYGDPRLPMYTNIPFYIGIRDTMVYGLFYHNTYKSFFNFGVSTPDYMSITADGGDVDYFFIYDTDIPKIITHYTSLTGRMPLPPMWSLGYHQSRCSYFPQANVKILAETFRKKEIPIDCIVLDADYLQDYEPFRINTERFPDMKGLSAYLKSLDLEVTASVNPGIKIDSTYFAHEDGLKKGVFVKYSNGDLYTAEIAPSMNHYVDFTNPKGRAWWVDHMKFLPENGIHGYWNDMNEPAVGGSYIPDNLWFDFDGTKANGLQAKNVYGMLMARSSYESALKYGENRRPFILTRSGFAGVQRYAATWTGDNTAKEEFLLLGALLNTQMGLSGLPFVGDDIGGYIGNTSKELFARWIEVGVFEPFCRNHKEAFATANEPWSYGEEAEAIAKEYIGFRYRLMPYLYSKFYEATQTGMPIARSLCMNYPNDPLVYNALYQYQFMCGDALMIVPVTPSEKIKKHYLPGSYWFDLYSDEKVAGNRELIAECPIFQIPVFVKPSSIIPMQGLVQSTKQNPGDTLFLHLFSGDESNEICYYEDDGATMDYQKGAYYKRWMRFDPAKKVLTLDSPEGNWKSRFKVIKVVLHGFDKNIETVKINGKAVQTKEERIRMLDGLCYLETIYDNNYFKSLRNSQKMNLQTSFIVDNSSQKIAITY